MIWREKGQPPVPQNNTTEPWNHDKWTNGPGPYVPRMNTVDNVTMTNGPMFPGT